MNGPRSRAADRARRAVRRRRRRRGHAAARVRVRHAGDCGRQPDQRLRNAGRARIRDRRSTTRARPNAFTGGSSTRTSARTRKRSRCGPSSCTSRSSAPAPPGSSSRRSCTTRRATLVSYGLDRIDPEKDMRFILIEAARSHIAGVAASGCPMRRERLLRRLASACARRARRRSAAARRQARGRRGDSGRTRRVGRGRQGAGFPEATWTGSRPIASTNSSSGRRCRRRAMTTSSRSATAPHARGSARQARSFRRARRPRTSRRRTW